MKRCIVICLLLLITCSLYAQTAQRIEGLLGQERVTYAQADDTVNLKGLSIMVMRAFALQGGLLYTLTGSPHHAYRELQRMGIIQGRADPLLPVSGEMLLFTINRTLFVSEQ